MNVKENIDFATSLLNKLHITTNIIQSPDKSLTSSIDGGLREMLFGESDYARLLINSPTEAKKNVIYRFFDEYRCCYIFLRIPKKESSFLFAGPYLKELPTDDYITKKAEQLSLSSEKREQLKVYYRNLPIVEDENVILSIMDTLGSFIFGGADNFNVEYVSYEIPDKRRPVYNSGAFEGFELQERRLTLDALEENYKNERLLMEAVSRGKLNKVDFVASSVINQGAEERLPDSLRNRKNYLIILNTLLRKAAEYGAVHPLHIHNLSAEFAKRIEGLFSIEESLELQKNMIRRYCQLVKEHSLKKFSNLIGRVITLISYDLTADLSLRSIASIMNVNASYLSASFKKETGETLTDYVNGKRMENAAFVLSHTDKQIQIVAEECGILDVNYFIKMFKKRYGITPTQYRLSVIRL